jgi:predicted nucleotidyltransferase component of viral defense system
MDKLEYELNKWRDYSGALGFVKPEHAEKDYLQELLLFELYSGRLRAALLFRGGTAISKFYGSGRFSEDIDLILANDVDASRLGEEIDAAIKRIGLYYPLESKKVLYRNMTKYDLKIKGPIYFVANNEQAKQSIKIDLNTYERPQAQPNNTYRIPVYEDLKPYNLLVATKEELLADKIKAIVERTSPVARDLYDAWLLIRKYGIKPNLAMVEKKIFEYGKQKGERFSTKDLRSRIEQIGDIWDTELSRLMKAVPDYKSVKKEFEDAIAAH